jgi:cysteinyl-tRNA synthetase
VALKLYNTLGRKKQEFKPIKKGQVGIYSCGPTVYWFQHIGNLRSYIFSDLLKRVLKYNHYKVKHIINITDVGHLTSDTDEGEDKIEKAAAKEGKTAEEIANYYWKIFREDFKKLNIIEPDIWCKATEHIKEQIELIKKIEKKGYTYKTKDGIYFDTSKLKDYGKLAKLKIDNLQAGKRIAIGEKKNKTDFALWKFSKKPGERQQEWDSPWRTGFPGWHIECSAMAMKYLGETIDIHTGGEDHIHIHHTNEIAQSESATGKKFVNYWLHGAFLTFKGEKVSKSKGGLYTISELEKQNFLALAYRYLCLTAHYKTQLEFSLETLENAQNSYKRLKNIISELKDDKKINEKYLKEFEKTINDDLNTPIALQVLWKLVRDEKAEGKYLTIAKMDEVFGLDLLKKEDIKIPVEIESFVNEREKARVKKDWKKADKIRDKIKGLGYNVSDSSEGPKITKL